MIVFGLKLIAIAAEALVVSLLLYMTVATIIATADNVRRSIAAKRARDAGEDELPRVD